MNKFADDAAQRQDKANTSNRLFAVLMVLACIGAGWYASRNDSPNRTQRPSTIGVYVPSLPVVTLAGVQETIALDRAERPTVVYVMSPDCRWCGYNMRNIKSLALARSGEYRFIGVSPPHPDLARYAELNKLPFPIFQIASLDAVPNLLLGQTPSIQHQHHLKLCCQNCYFDMAGRVCVDLRCGFSKSATIMKKDLRRS